MPINYADPAGSADDGYNNPDSIQPYENGEAANADTFQRTPENLRDRTEVVRTALDDNFLTDMGDRGLILACDSGVTVTWNGPNSGAGDGKFALSSLGEIRLIPIVNPADFSAKNDIYARLSYKIGTDSYFTVRTRGDHTTPLRAYNGANNVKLELFYVSGVTVSPPTVTVEGSKNSGGDYDPAEGPVLIKVQLSHDGGGIVSDWSDVQAAINNHADASEWVEAFVETGGASSLAVEIDEQFLWEGTGTNVSGIGALDAAAFRITKAEIDNFFSAANPGEDGMDDGDALVIDYETARDRLAVAGDATVGAALRLIHRNENDLADDDDKFSSVGNAFQGNCIPVCKVIDSDLYFVNGTAVIKDETAYLREDTSKLRTDLAKQLTPGGSSLVGSVVQGGTPQSLTVGTVEDQLGEILGFYNDHVTGTSDKHDYKDITGKPVVTVGSGGAADYSSLDAAMTALASSGGTIVLTSSLSENVSVSVSDDITVLGNGNGIQGIGGGAVIRLTGQPTNKPSVVFKNLAVTAVLDQVLVQVDTYETVNEVIFDNCHLRSNSSGTATVVTSNGSMKFIDCHIDGQIQTRDMFEISATGGANQQSLVVERCKLETCRRVLACTGAENDLGYVAFRDNKITDGVESGGGNNRWMFDGNPSAHRFETFILEGNVADGEGALAKVQVYNGYGLIARNKFDSTFNEDVQLHYVIDADMDLTSSISPRRFHIEGNELGLNSQLAGILARQYCVVSENTLYNFWHNAGAGITAHYGIFVPDGDGAVDIIGNKIHGRNGGLSGSGFICIKIGESSTIEGIRISHNSVTVPDGYYGFLVDYAEHVTMSGNEFTSLATTTLTSAFGFNAKYCSAVGNTFKNRGIGVSGEFCTVCGNTFEGAGTSNNAIAVAGSFCTISGNTAYNWGDGVSVGSGATDVSITGNMIYTCTRGIYLNIAASAHASVSGNQVRVGATDTGIYITNNAYVGFAGNECSGSSAADIDLPSTSNNIGGGAAGAATNALTLNLYGNTATH